MLCLPACRLHGPVAAAVLLLAKFTVLCLPVQFRSEFKLATLVYKFIHTAFPKYFAPYLSTYHTIFNTRHSQNVQISSMYQNFNLQFTSPLSSLASVLPLILPLFEIHFLKTFVHHPLLPLLERNSKTISMQRHILLSIFSYGFSVVLTFFCPWTLNLHIDIVLLHLRVHDSVEIKRYKS